MSIFASLAFAILSSWYLLKPLFSDSDFVSESNAAAKLQLLNDQKNRSIYMLRDLELDYATGKLSKDEYNSIKEELTYELAGVMKKIDEN